MHCVASYLTPEEAWLAKGRLEAAGIPAEILNAHMVSINWLYSNAVGGVRVVVPDDEAQHAAEVLDASYADVVDELDEAKLPRGADETCPACGRDALGPRDLEGLSFLASLTLLAVSCPVPVLLRRPGWRCRACGATGRNRSR